MVVVSIFRFFVFEQVLPNVPRALPGFTRQVMVPRMLFRVCLVPLASGKTNLAKALVVCVIRYVDLCFSLLKILASVTLWV